MDNRVAGVVELADTLVSGTSILRDVRVRIPPPAPAIPAVYLPLPLAELLL